MPSAGPRSLLLLPELYISMAPPLLRLDQIALTFGGTPLLSDAAISVSEGDRIALVGRNGSGKSTLLKIAAGFVDADRRRSVQASGRDGALPGAGARHGRASPPSAPMSRRALGPADDLYRVSYLLEHLGLTGEEKPDNLSGGETRRAALGQSSARPNPTSCCSTSRPTIWT